MMRLASGVSHMAGSTPTGAPCRSANEKVYVLPLSIGRPPSSELTVSKSRAQKLKRIWSPSSDRDQLAEPIGVCALPFSKKKKALGARAFHAGDVITHGPVPTTAR